MKKFSTTTVNSLGEDHLKVLEIYNAFQGEGTRIGQACVFVRLAGCTVGCDWCDTKYSWKAAQGTQFDVKHLVKAIDDLKHSHDVVITGGEPLEHPTHLLVRLLNALGMDVKRHITIETSGTGHEDFNIEDLEDIEITWPGSLLFSVSPKLPSAEASKPFPDLRRWSYLAAHLKAQLQIKPVINDTLDFDFFMEQMGDFEELDLWIENTIVFQPATDTSIRDMDELRRAILHKTLWLEELVHDRLTEDQLQVSRVLPQFHTLLFGQKRGV